jgi:hypothetical protein
MNMHDQIKQMLDICQSNPTTQPSAARLLVKYEADVKRVFGSSGTVEVKVSAIDHHREQLARGLALLVIIAGGDQGEQLDQGDQGEQLGTVRHEATELGEVIGIDGDRVIRKLPADVQANVDKWALASPADVPEVGELPAIPAPAEVGELPAIPAPAEVAEELPPAPKHPTQRDHPARPSKGKRKPH